MPAAAPAVTTAKGESRVDSIDAVRGAIMIVMALDHVRDFIHRAAMTSSPTDLSKTTTLLFFTRWITHFCAPVFMFAAGLGAFLYWQQGKTRGQLSVFLLTRGAWLMLLELTIMRFAYNFGLTADYPVLLLVLWVLGLCMVVMSAVVWLPLPTIAVASVATIALHNTLDTISAKQFGDASWLWSVLHQPGVFNAAGALVIVGYPLVPWIAVMALGFVCGRLYQLEPKMRQNRLVMIGAVLCVGFVVVRGLNHYGDPQPWSTQSSATFTLLSFLNTTKYPPSFAFLLMTLGPALLGLAWVDRVSPARTHPLVVLGRVPLFYFVTHFFAAHIAAAALALARYGSTAWAFVVNPVPSMGAPPGLYPKDFGYDLWVVYVVWAAIVIALYPACRWFASVKATRRWWWLSYL